MNILFITNFFPVNGKNLYTDLVDELILHQHKVYVIASNDNQLEAINHFNPSKNLFIISYKTGKYYNVGIIKKLFSFLLLPFITNKVIKEYLPNQSYDLLLYHSPPITFYFSVKYIQKIRKIKKTFLMQKDFFPQNAVDLKILNKYSLTYLIFRIIEKNYFKISNYIGVMSLANRTYLLENNKFIAENKVIVFPNTKKMSNYIRYKDFRKIFPIRIFYGGNIGLPQNVDLFIQVLNKLKNDDRFIFVVSGRGNQKYKITDFIKRNSVQNVEIYDNLKNEEYLTLLTTIDISLVTLNFNFSIPNYPSRILDFIDFYIPMIFSLDEYSDLKDILENYKVGFYCKSDSYLNIVEILYNYEKLISLINYDDFQRLKLVFDVKHSINNINSIIEKVIK